MPTNTSNCDQTGRIKQSETEKGPTPISQGNSCNVNRVKIYQLITDLSNPETREIAMKELVLKREIVPDLAPMLWHSFGTIAALLQEIINTYPALSPPALTALQSSRVCNALAVLQCVASHKDTRREFLMAEMPHYLYPFLQTTARTKPFDFLRLTSLSVIDSLLKDEDSEVINFLLNTNIIQLCLSIMESDFDLSKTVASYILVRILQDESGLNHVCQTYDRFSYVAIKLGRLVEQLAVEPNVRLLKHVICCYLRLSDNTRACEALHQILPDQLKDETFAVCYESDKSVKQSRTQLLHNIVVSRQPNMPPSSTPTKSSPIYTLK